MKRPFAPLASVLFFSLTAAHPASAAAGRAPDGHPAAADTYTITATLEVVNPIAPAVMADGLRLS